MGSRLVISKPPYKAAGEAFDEDDERLSLARLLAAETGRLPTRQQLQTFVKSKGKTIPYSAAAALVKSLCSKLFNAIARTEVTAISPDQTEYTGRFNAWSEKSDRWRLDIWVGRGSRFDFVAGHQPVVEISGELKEWLLPKSD